MIPFNLVHGAHLGDVLKLLVHVPESEFAVPELVRELFLVECILGGNSIGFGPILGRFLFESLWSLSMTFQFQAGFMAKKHGNHQMDLSRNNWSLLSLVVTGFDSLLSLHFLD